MAQTKQLQVKELKLDLANFRTVKQNSELKAIHALIAIDTDWFWELMRSLLANGYLPVETIVVQKVGTKLVVMEGNRRIAALKLIFNYVKRAQFDLPADISAQIVALPQSWKDENSKVPCTIYGPSEHAAVDRVVSLTHGKAEKAGRANWKSIATARHSRDKQAVSEPGLDVLERYLGIGQNLTNAGRDRWAGDYPLTVLDEALKTLAPRLGFVSAKALSAAYPNIPAYRSGLENLMRDIGLQLVDFKAIRDKSVDFAIAYGVPPLAPASAQAPASGATSAGATNAAGAPVTSPATSNAKGSSSKGASSSKPASTPNAPQHPTTAPSGAISAAINTSRAVMNTLNIFAPKGHGREKVIALVDEARSLKLSKQPHAFCFLLRSLMEISAKVYCDDHKGTPNAPVATQPNGFDKPLLDLLKEVTKHLGANDAASPSYKTLHGAMTEIANPHSILSVKSLNQLIHSPNFSVSETHIATVFHNVFPLLEALN